MSATGYIVIDNAQLGNTATYANNSYGYIAPACNGLPVCRFFVFRGNMALSPNPPNTGYFYVEFRCTGDVTNTLYYIQTAAVPAAGLTATLSCSASSSSTFALSPLQVDLSTFSSVTGMSILTVYRTETNSTGSPVGGVNGEWWMGSGAGYDAAAWSAGGQWLTWGGVAAAQWQLSALIIDSIPVGGTFPHGQGHLYTNGALSGRGFMDVPRTFQVCIDFYLWSVHL
jgi:hypothetical protein